MRSAMPTKVAKVGYLVMSGLLCFLGALVIWDPEASIRTVGLLCGLTMLAFGAVKLVGYFSKDLFRLAFENDLSSGILMLALGVSLLLHTEGTLSFFCTVIGILILADGLFMVQIAADARPFGIRQWGLLMAAAIATAACGGILIFRPGASMRLMARLLGVSLILEGALNVITMLTTVSTAARRTA